MSLFVDHLLLFRMQRASVELGEGSRFISFPNQDVGDSPALETGQASEQALSRTEQEKKKNTRAFRKVFPRLG
jgi:hypothetical protein